MSEKKKKGVIRSFPSTYWIVILFEFFERGSYYGMMSVLSIYLTDVLGFAKTGVGLIKGTIQPILYFLPIISGALADRFGYRKTLTVAFALLGGGYFLTSQMTSYSAVFLALCVMALGAGTFKPIISGSIARTTDKSNSTLGFGIYYWSINLGAFLFPLILVPFLKNSPIFGWRWVIIASALGTGAMIIPTLFFYKEPPKPEAKDKGKSLNLIKTVANAFEIIYSPFVLIYHYLRSSKPGTKWVWAIIVILIALSVWQYSNLKPVTEEIVEATILQEDTALIFKVERDVMRKNPYKIDTYFVEEIEGYNILVSKQPDMEAAEYIKKVHRDGKDIAVTIQHPEPRLDSLIANLSKQVANYVHVTKDNMAPLFQRVISDSTNRVVVTVFKPDQYEQYKSTLLADVQKYSSLSDVTPSSVSSLVDKAQNKALLTAKLEKSENIDRPYTIEKGENDDIILTIHDTETYSNYKTGLLEDLRAYPNLTTLSQTQLDELVDSSQQRSFFLPYLVLLFLTSLLILKIQKQYVQSDKVKKAIYNLVSFAGIVIIIWLIPGLDLFSRIVSTVIYFTVLSLYTIEIEDQERFKDNFRFLLMIFIYSGFWILYFQMFDSVLWYVKAYVDATSLNNFVNSFLGFFGVNINWFFDVEHVTVINAGTIILLQLIVSNIVKNFKALPTMITGIAMGTMGMAILAISTDIWVFMMGIIIFSIGEMTAHPKFISYVGLTAPKDRVATYMGYIFLYGVIGSSIGAILGANMYVHFVDKLNQPRTLWLIFSGIGIITIVGLLLFNKFAPKKSEED